MESLFEAAALGLKALRNARLAECKPGIATELEIAVNAAGGDAPTDPAAASALVRRLWQDPARAGDYTAVARTA